MKGKENGRWKRDDEERERTGEERERRGKWGTTHIYLSHQSPPLLSLSLRIFPIHLDDDVENNDNERHWEGFAFLARRLYVVAWLLYDCMAV